MEAPVRSILKYFGSKWLLARQIIAQFPPHTVYCEPFGGAAAVLLQKEPAEVTIYNDLDGEVVNFFRVLREQPDALERAIQLTPWSKEEYHQAYLPARTALERARRFYVRSFQARGDNRINARAGFRFGTRHAMGQQINRWNKTDHFDAVLGRLKHTLIEHDNFASVIERYDTPGTLFYCDPPYPLGTRRPKSYTCEMTDEQHRDLAQNLSQIKGMALVSSYPCALYDQLYTGWRKVEIEVKTGSLDGGGLLRTEVLWFSPNTDRAITRATLGAIAAMTVEHAGSPHQMPLFEVA